MCIRDRFQSAAQAMLAAPPGALCAPGFADHDCRKGGFPLCRSLSIHILPVFVKTIFWITDFNGFPKVPSISTAKQIFYGIILTLF